MQKLRVRFLIATLAAATTMTLLPMSVPTASAAAPTTAPTGLTPDGGENASGNPQLSWSPMAGVTRYRVQVDDTANFSSLLADDWTYNTTYTPLAELPVGELYWRVAGADPSSALGPFASATFEKDLPAPDLLAPSNNAELNFPEDVPTFSWTPTLVTKSYVLEVDDAPDFNGANRYVTRNTGYTPLDPQPVGDYYWRVRGSSATNGTGVLTTWSSVRSYSVSWTHQPALTMPDNLEQVTDVDLRWAPVPGATAYNLLIDQDQEFTSPYVTGKNLHSTRLSYKDSLQNGTYWWKVQAIDIKGNLGPWSAPQRFTRNWPAQPELVAPADNTATSGNMAFEWKPIDHAAHYKIQTASDPFFSNAVKTCTTVQTRIYSGASCNLDVARAGGFYWRVSGVDGPNNVQGLWSSPFRVVSHTPLADVAGTFNPSTPVAPQLPANCSGALCAMRATPTLTWNGTPGATRYELYVATDPNFTTLVGGYGPLRLDHQTAYTALNELRDNDAGGAYYWHVRPCNTVTANGPLGCGPDPVGNASISSRTFKKSSTPVDLLSPAQGESVENFPFFEWEDYLDTTSNDVPDPAPGTTDLEAYQYQLQVSTVSTFATLVDDKTMDQTFYAPWDRTYAEGPLYWRVRAIDGSRNKLAWSETRSIQKVSPTPAPIAPMNDAQVEGVPRFEWAPLDYAARYEYEVYKNDDDLFSNANRVLNVTTSHTEDVPVGALPPGTYRWRIRRIDVDYRVGAWTNEPGQNAPRFTIKKAAVPLVSPDDNARIIDSDLVFAWSPVPLAASYRFERSASPAMTSPTVNRVTVMSAYADTTKIANGTWYWRVTALDSSNVPIGTSQVRRFVQADPPADGSVFIPIAPCRVVDTRSGGGPFTPNDQRDYQIAGTGAGFAAQGGAAGGCGIPTGSSAVEASVTAVTPSNGGYFRAWPADVPAPNATFLNFTGGQSVTNTGSITLASSAVRGLRVRNYSATSHYVIDVQGYFIDRTAVSDGSLFVPVTPCRVIDTRSRNGAPFTNREQRSYRVAGSGPAFAAQGGRNNGCGIPAGASAVSASVSAVGPTGSGFYRVWPSDVAAPNATFLNYSTDRSITNTGAITLASQGSSDLTMKNYGPESHFVVDVQGYYIDRDLEPDGAVYVGVTPCRVIDTRSKLGAMTRGQERTYQVAGTGNGFAGQGGASGGCAIPDGAAAVSASVSAVTPDASGYFRAWPSNVPAPNATYLNYAKDSSITNTGALALAPRTTKDLRMKNYDATSHYVVDVQGYYVR